MSSGTTHYTAVVDITETTREESTSASYDRRHSAPKPTGERTKSDVLKLVLRDDTLPGLAEKLASHLAIHTTQKASA